MYSYSITVTVRCKCGAFTVVHAPLHEEFRAGDFGGYHTGRLLLDLPDLPEGWYRTWEGAPRCPQPACRPAPRKPKAPAPEFVRDGQSGPPRQHWWQFWRPPREPKQTK